MRARGATVERTPDAEGMKGAIRRAKELVASDKSAFMAGQFENQARAQQRMMIVLGGVLILMLVLLYGQFGVFRHAFLILIIVPLAMFGGLVALHLRDMTLNVASAVGFRLCVLDRPLCEPSLCVEVRFFTLFFRNRPRLLRERVAPRANEREPMREPVRG